MEGGRTHPHHPTWAKVSLMPVRFGDLLTMTRVFVGVASIMGAAVYSQQAWLAYLAPLLLGWGSFHDCDLVACLPTLRPDFRPYAGIGHFLA